MKKSTISDVAAAAGVSNKTVSRVINNEPNVRPEKEELVKAAIAKLGYRPNPSARSLRSNKSYLIGLLYENPAPYYVVAVQEGALKKCDEQGYDLLLRPCSFSSSGFVAQVVNFTAHSNTDGLILTPPLCDNEPLIRALDKANVSFVRISPFRNHSSPQIASNEFDAAMKLTEHLISLGHEKIGIILGHPEHGASHWRLEGYKSALKNAGIRINERFIQKGDFSFESGEKGARKLLNMKDRPTAIFASNDYMAAAVYKVASQLGLLIPQSLSVVGFDDAPIASQLWPPLTTVKQPTEELSNLATQLLINQIRQTDISVTEQKPLKCELIIRNSTNPVTKP